MLAVRFYGVGDVRCEEIAPVVLAPGQALIRVLYGGICGSDLHIYREGMFVEKIPETMGHEFVGRVESAPVGCSIQKGDLVVGDPRMPCGNCDACKAQMFHRCAGLGFIGEVRPGCFAEYLALEPEKLIKLPPDTDRKQAALAEPLAVAVHACKAVAATGVTEALIVGAGPIGLLIACLLKRRYGFARVAVTDIDAFRRNKALEAGADEAFQSISESGQKYGCIVDAVGVGAVLNDILAAAAPGGYIFISAIYEKTPVVEINALVSGELTIAGNNAYCFEDIKEAAQIISEEKLDFSWLVTSVLPAKSAAEAFQLLTAKQKRDLKILLRFDEE